MTALSPARPRRVRPTHRIRVPLPLEQAVPLFTPEGERAWVEGWAPAWPEGDGPPAQPTGSVFVTAADGHVTVWVTTRRDAHGATFARVTPGRWAGTVDVRCRAVDGGTEVEVRYDLTALEASAWPDLAAFADGFGPAIDGWAVAIEAALAGGRLP